MNLYQYVGVAERNAFEVLLAEDQSAGSFALTGGADPTRFDQDRIDLTASDGMVLLVHGIAEGGWIRSAAIVETGGVLDSLIAQAAFGRKPRFPTR